MMPQDLPQMQAPSPVFGGLYIEIRLMWQNEDDVWVSTSKMFSLPEQPQSAESKRRITEMVNSELSYHLGQVTEKSWGGSPAWTVLKEFTEPAKFEAAEVAVKQFIREWDRQLAENGQQVS